jgi:folate-binding protein YgfZ
MNQLRLRDQHAEKGAVFVEAGGWEVPAHYGNPAAEHDAVRRDAGVADLSHRGMLRVTGDDRIKWLQSIISNDILPLAPGHGAYSSLLTHKGKMVSYFRVYVLPDSVLVEDVGEIRDVTFQALRKFLLYGTKAKLENLGPSWTLLLVSGPRAPEVIRAAFGCDVAPLKPLQLLTHDAGGRPAMFIRSEETGEPDIEILVPGEAASEVWQRLWTAGHPLGLAAFGAEAREVLRLEAGLPKAGTELTEEIVPPEANLEGKAFSLSKGCYPGQEVVARMDTYGSVRRRMVTLLIESAVVPPRGAKVFSADREVGWVSSAARSPAFAGTIALAFPLRDFSGPGTALAVEVDGQRHNATVRAMPLYERKG